MFDNFLYFRCPFFTHLRQSKSASFSVFVASRSTENGENQLFCHLRYFTNEQKNNFLHFNCLSTRLMRNKNASFFVFIAFRGHRRLQNQLSALLLSFKPITSDQKEQVFSHLLSFNPPAANPNAIFCNFVVFPKHRNARNQLFYCLLHSANKKKSTFYSFIDGRAPQCQLFFQKLRNQ